LGLGLLLCALIFSGCADREVGSQKRPFTVMFVPSVDAQTISSQAKEFESFVSKKMSQLLYGKDEGFYVKASVPTSYIAVVEAFGTNKVDFAVFNTFGYLLARDIKKYPVEVVGTVTRAEIRETTYKGQIITRADSGINSLEDLKGKKFAFTDPASTSGFILPQALLNKKGIELGEVVFGTRHDTVVTMVYQGQVDAGATYYSSPDYKMENGKRVEILNDARARVKTQFPDVFEKVKILAYTDDIPNEPWVVRTNLYKDPAMNEKVVKGVVDAIFEFATTEEGKKLVMDVATGHGLVKLTDDDYNKIRGIIRDAKINVEEVLSGKKS
jgi:phosphonate transport system substrate-binding protein